MLFRENKSLFLRHYPMLKVKRYHSSSGIINIMSIFGRLQNKANRAFRIVAVSLLALVVGWFCLVASNTNQHTNQMLDKTGSCANCHLDGQTSVTLKIDEEKDDIEPTPPPFWVRPIVPLAFLYNLIPITFLGYLILRHKIHLTTQMRF